MKKGLFTGLLFFCTLSLFAQVKIVVLGSSTAAGTGASTPDSAWVNRYRKFLQTTIPGSSVVNLSKGGYTTYHILPTGYVQPPGRPATDPVRNITAALSYQPDAIIINLPSNDATSGYTIAEQLSNYDTVVARAQAAQIPVWIATTQGRNLSTTGLQLLVTMRDSTLARYGEQAIDFFTDIALPNGSLNPVYNAGDGIHLNNAGHRILFERVKGKNIPEATITPVLEAPGAHLSFEIRPNPTQHEAILNFEQALDDCATLQITDAAGATWYMGAGAILAGKTNVQLSVAHWPAGMYVVHLKNGVHSGVQKLIRN